MGLIRFTYTLDVVLDIEVVMVVMVVFGPFKAPSVMRGRWNQGD